MSNGNARDSREPDVVKATRPVLRGADGSDAVPPTRLKGTITAGDEVETSYYGLPVIKAPHWRWLIIIYFFLGGIAGGSFSIAALGDLLSADRRLVRTARYMSLAAVTPSPVLLTLDLGRSERTLHMFRILKLRSPMSLGSWALLFFGGFCSLSAFFQAIGDLFGRDVPAVLRRTVDILGLPFALFVSGYTGLLLAATNIPLWARNYLLLGPTFMASAFSTSCAAISLTLGLSGKENEDTVRRLARLEQICLVSELTLLLTGLARMGKLGRPLTSGPLAAIFWPLTVGMGMVAPLVSSASGSKRGRRLPAMLVLVGGFTLRMVMIFGGRESARNPAYYFEYTRKRS